MACLLVNTSPVVKNIIQQAALLDSATKDMLIFSLKKCSFKDNLPKTEENC